MTIYRPMQPIQTDDEFASILDELSFCLKTLTTRLGLDFRKRLRLFLAEHRLDHDPQAFAELPTRQYAYIELFGHTCLGACLVREVERFGVKMCEARPLGLDGEPGAAQRFPGTAIYRERELTEEEARQLAMPRMLSVVSRVPLTGQGGEAEQTDFPPPPDDGTPLCEPIKEGEDDIPF